MNPLITPFQVPLTPEAFHAFRDGKISRRRLSSLSDYYCDQQAAKACVEQSDPFVYEVWELEYEAVGRGLSFGMTRIYPGMVGNEYFFTRGHFHADSQGDEMYIVLSGRGMLVMSSRTGECQTLEMIPGQMCYVPGHLAHRTVNVGDEPLVFFTIWPPNLVHDYDTIAQTGFPKLIVSSASGPEVVSNPNYE